MGPHPIRDRFSFSALARADDRVADLGRAVAVLEGRTVGANLGVAGDRRQEVVQLVDEGVSPTDDVAWRPPVLRERVIGLRDEHTLEAACPVAVGPEDLQLVEALHVEEEGPLGAVDLPLERVSPAEGESSRLDGADGAILELDRRLDGVVDLAPRDERAHEASDGLDLPDEVASEVDHVSREIAESSRTGGPAVEAPDLFGGIAPVLQVTAPEVTQLAELARVDYLSREAHGGDEAVVEPAHVLYAGRRDALPDLVALVCVTSEGLLADHVLARLGGGDRRSRVHIVWPQVVDEPDLGVRDELLPLRRPALVAVTRRSLGDRLLVPAGNRHEPRPERRRPRHVADLAEGIGVRLAHERIAEHAHADLAEVVGGHRISFTTRLPHTRVILGCSRTTVELKRLRRARHEDLARNLGARAHGHPLRAWRLPTAEGGRDDSRTRAASCRRSRRPDRRLRVPLPAGAECGEPRRGEGGARRARRLLHGDGAPSRPAVRKRGPRLAGPGHARRSREADARRNRLLRRARRPLHHLAGDRGLQLPVPDTVRRVVGVARGWDRTGRATV